MDVPLNDFTWLHNIDVMIEQSSLDWSMPTLIWAQLKKRKIDAFKLHVAKKLLWIWILQVFPCDQQRWKLSMTFLLWCGLFFRISRIKKWLDQKSCYYQKSVFHARQPHQKCDFFVIIVCPTIYISELWRIDFCIKII